MSAVQGTPRMQGLRRRLDAMRPKRDLGPIALLVVSIAAIGVVLWGEFFADPDITVSRFDAGPVDDYAIGKVVAFPEVDLYLVGLRDGRIRALDGRVEASGCSAHWLPDDTRAARANPGRVPGALVDPCSGAVWSMEGNAVSGTTRPLRTPQVTYKPGPDGTTHVYVELINHPAAP